MKYKKIIHQIIPPCSKCPYTLGQVHTLTNPCPQCKLNGYNMYEQFNEQANGTFKNSNGDERNDD